MHGVIVRNDKFKEQKSYGNCLLNKKIKLRYIDMLDHIK